MQNQKKVLFSNFLSLSALQIVNYILPLVTLPYLVRVLGVEYFGLLAFATATVTYFSILTDYGFNLTATREISIHKENKEKITEIFSSVMSVKFALMLISFILLTLLVVVFEKFRNDAIIYFYSFGIVVGQFMFPIWFFQGMQKMKYITYLNILSKVIFTSCIFLFVHHQSDYYLVPVLTSLGFLVAGISSLWIIFKQFNMKFEIQNIATLQRYFQDGWYVFTGTVGISFYKNNAILILGLFADHAVVGYFSIAKKLIDVSNQFAGILSQSIFPHIAQEVAHDKEKSKIFLKKIGLLIGSVTLVIGLVILLFSKDIISLVSGSVYEQSVWSLEMMAFVPLVIGINVPAVQLLLGTSNSKHFSHAVMSGAVLDIALNFLLVPNYSYVGSSITVILTELFVTLYLYFKVYKLKL